MSFLMYRGLKKTPTRGVLVCLAVVVVVAGASGVVLATSPGTGHTLVVDGDADGDDEFVTIGAAVANATAGDTVKVRAGTYNGTVRIDKEVTLTGETGADTVGPGQNPPVLDGRGRVGSAIVLADNVSDVTVRGFEIRNYTGSFPNGSGIVAENDGTTNVTVRENYIHDVSIGIVASVSRAGTHAGWSVADNRLANLSSAGVYLENTRESRVTGNRIIGTNGVSGSGNTSYGIGIRATSTATTEVDAVRIENNSLTGTFKGFGGIINVWSYATRGTRNTVLRSVAVRNNTIDERSSLDSPTRGINVYARGNRSSGAKGVITNVTVAGNRISGVPLSAVGIGGPSSGLVSIRNVSITDNEVTAVGKSAVLVEAREAASHSHLSVVGNTAENTSHDSLVVRSLEEGTLSRVRIANNSVTRGKAALAAKALANGTTASVTVNNNEFTDSQFGIFVNRRDSGALHDLVLQGNRIVNNSKGVYVTSSTSADVLDVHFNSILDNTDAGVHNDNGTVLNATDNWWGRSDGPVSDQCLGNVNCGDPLSSPPSRTEHESGVPKRVFDAVAGDDGVLDRSDVLTMVRRYVGDRPVSGVNVSRSAVLELVRYYARQ